MSFELSSSLLMFMALWGLIFFYNYKKSKNRKHLVYELLLICTVIGIASLYSYLKRSEINLKVASGDVKDISGVVSNFNRYNGKDIFYINNVKFEVYYDGIYCLSGMEEVKNGSIVNFKYVDLGVWNGIYMGNCILEF